ncbi:MAG: hypothetical protein LBL91_03890, partial [Lachnospiraceae bacterium]|nr:hypothetical protein [Lachnospiraceae bacterium]
VETKWQPTDNTKPTPMIKKRLVANQVIIAYMRKVSSFDTYTVKPVLKAKVAGKLLKASAGIRIKKASKFIDLIFEVARREEDWEKYFSEKMKLYKDFYDNFVQFDCGYEKSPQLIFVCEDEKHMVEVFKLIVTNKLEIDGLKLLFTTDLKQNENKLDESLCEFVLDEKTKKYKIENVKLAILG